MTDTTEHPESITPTKNSAENMQDQLPPLRNAKPNNNRHVVTFGIIIVLFTLYITATAIRHTNSSIDHDMDREKRDLLNLRKKENERQAKILENLLEHENICTELEIFVKEFKWNEKPLDASNIKSNKAEKIEKIELKDGLPSAEKEINDIDINTEPNNEQEANNNSNNLEILKRNLDENKKEEIKKKKSTTAEPIIYLFALVFIYLLLKAASDINQHWKSQAKGDKRLRRCSLQSYAQTHKQDRRSSKDKPLSAINQRHFLEQRSQSFDRPAASLRKNISAESEFQLESRYRYPGTPDRKVVYASDAMTSDLNVSSSRRCSVPALLHSQKQKIMTTSKILDLNRRTSIVSGSNTGTNSLAGSIENVDLQFPENKRRVRMITRH